MKQKGIQWCRILILLLLLLTTPFRNAISLKAVEIGAGGTTNLSWGAETEDFEEEDPVRIWGTYQYTVSESEVTIVGYVGSLPTTLNIPSEIEGLPVTRIAASAFENDPFVFTVKLPATLTEMNSRAFTNCRHLFNFLVEEGNPVYSAYEGVLYDVGQTTLLRCPAMQTTMKTTFPETVTAIAEYAFADCTALESVVFPPTVKTIGKYAFSGCTNLETVYFSASLQSVATGAFQGCTSLKNMDISCVQKLGGSLFADCTALESVSISGTVENLPKNSFLNCTALRRVSLPSTVQKIEEGAFANCQALEELGDLPEELTQIKAEAFAGCHALKQITLPEQVTSVAATAFYDCRSLEWISVLEENPAYTAVDGVLFQQDGNILLKYPPEKPDTAYQIPDNVERLEVDAFSFCKHLETITFSDTLSKVRSMEEDTERLLKCFNGCTALREFMVPEENPYYQAVDGVLFNKVHNSLYWYPSGKEDIRYSIPEGTLTINTLAFSNLVHLRELVIPQSVNTIFPYAIGAVAEETGVGMENSITIYGMRGSMAATYAQEYALPFCSVQAEETTTDVVEGTTTATEVTETVTTVTELPETTNVEETTVTIPTTTTVNATTATTTEKTTTETTFTKETQATSVTGTTMESNLSAGMTGDINEDGKINVEDAMYVLVYYAKHSANLDAILYSTHPEAEAAALERADVDEDGQLTLADVSAILKCYAEKSTNIR